MALTLELGDPAQREQLAQRAPARAEPLDLVGLSREDLGAALANVGVPQKQVRMRVSQLWHWLYMRGVNDFDRMSNISKEMRALLKANFTIGWPEIADEQISNDGTRKWLLRFPSRGAGRPVEVETVYIPE
jgi:23S rRNA (adenine2503-C2)-methyltransferase